MNKENIIFEDGNFYAIHLKDNANSIGHIRIYPQKEITNLEDLGEELFTIMFTMASLAATLIWENSYNDEGRGTTILMKSGSNASKEKTGYFELILREPEDGLNTKFETKQPEFHEFLDKLKNEAFIVSETEKENKDNLIKIEKDEKKEIKNQKIPEKKIEDDKPIEKDKENNNEEKKIDNHKNENHEKKDEDENNLLLTKQEKYKLKLLKNYKLAQIEKSP